MKKIIFILSFFMLDCLCCHASIDEKYFKTSLINNLYVTQEISEEEYNSVTEVELLNMIVETEYKKMTLSNTNNIVNLTVSWKKTPKYKSYDVIAIMSEDVDFITSSVSGVQIANLYSSTEYINYIVSTQNTKVFNNGIGISMNLLNDAINYTLELEIRYSGDGKIYGTYRHAQSNVSLAQSQNYSLNNGNIVFNNSSINSKYDSIDYVMINV